MQLLKNLLFLSLIVAYLSLASSKVIELNEKNWEQLLSGEWMIEL